MYLILVHGVSVYYVNVVVHVSMGLTTTGEQLWFVTVRAVSTHHITQISFVSDQMKPLCFLARI